MSHCTNQIASTCLLHLVVQCKTQHSWQADKKLVILFNKECYIKSFFSKVKIIYVVEKTNVLHLPKIMINFDLCNL